MMNHKPQTSLIAKATRLVAVMLALTTAYLLTGCGDSTGERKLSFGVGGAPAEIEIWEKIIADFTAATGIEVEIRRQPTDTDLRRQELLTSLRAGQSQPDVFLLDVAWLGQFAASQWLQPLDQLTTRGRLDPNNFFKRVIELADYYQGELVAMPVYIDAGLLYFRQDLFEQHGITEPPRTWDQLVEYSLRVQEIERQNDPQFYGYLWQGAQYEGLICNWLEVAVSAGGGIFDNNTLIIDSPANLKATKLLHDFIHEYEISPVNTYIEMKEEPTRRHFEQGKALFQRNWPYAWSLHQAEDSPIAGKVGIAPLPGFAGQSGVGTLGGWHIGISAFSEKTEDSFALLEYILSYEVQKRMATQLGWNPGRKDVYEDPELLQSMPHLQELQEVFTNAYPRPNVPYYTMLSEILQQQISAVLSQGTDPETGLEIAHREVAELISRYE